MATSVSISGNSYSVPAVGDSYGTSLTNLLIALSTPTKVLQTASTTFTLTSGDLDLGATYGIKSTYYKSRATNPSSAGAVRLGNNESVGFRNAANNADLLLKVNTSNQLEYNGNQLLDSAGSGLTGLITDSMVSASAAIARSKLATLTASRAMVTDGSGNDSVSAVTATELGYVSGVTSAIQTQINNAVPIGSIMAWAGGYFTNGSNAGYTYVLGSANSVAGANSYLNSSGFYVCDGSALNNASSPIWNSAGRYLPNLTDSRFLMGSTSAGTIGGSNSVTITSANLPTHTHTLSAHTHGVGTYATSAHSVTDPGHNHLFKVETTYQVSPGAGLTSLYSGNALTNNGTLVNSATTGISIAAHTLSGSSGTPSVADTGNGGFANTAIENRPLYLSTFYIIRVK